MPAKFKISQCLIYVKHKCEQILYFLLDVGLILDYYISHKNETYKMLGYDMAGGIMMLIEMSQNERIKKIRQYKGLTQKEVAQKMGVSVQSYSQYETGKRTPTRKTLDKIAEALGCDPSEIADDFIVNAKKIQGIAESTSESSEFYDQSVFTLLCHALNSEGRSKAMDYMCLLLNVPEYRTNGYKQIAEKAVEKHMFDILVDRVINKKTDNPFAVEAVAEMLSSRYFSESQNNSADIKDNALKEGE